MENKLLDNAIILSSSFQIDKDDKLAIAWKGNVFVDKTEASFESLSHSFLTRDSLSSFYAKLSGFFALIVADVESGSTYVFSDHMGSMPLFYTQQNGQTWLSDSLKPFKVTPSLTLTVSKQAIYNYFYFHCIPAPGTIYAECFKISPGHCITVSKQGGIEDVLLFNPHFASQVTDSAAHKDCLTHIDDGVKRELTENVGAFLSGGLDSSTVAGMLAKHAKPAKTFSIGFKAEAYDETEYAQITAKHFSTEHRTFYLEPEDAAKKFVEVAQYFDEPFGNSSAMAAYFCAIFAKENGVTKLLAGDGGDELFAGNERYAKQKVFEHYYKIPSALRTPLKSALSLPGVSSLSVVKKGQSYVRQAEIPLPQRLETYNFINQFGAENMFTHEFLNNVDDSLPEAMQVERYEQCNGEHIVDKMLFLDWKFTLADNDLVKVSKMCELAGIDVAYPMLEKELVEFSCSVPADTKLPGTELRDFYKKACEGFLADETLNKSKHGFGLPFGVWLKENAALKDIATTALEKFKARGIVKDSLIEQALEAHNNVHAGYYGELIWIMVILELWLSEHA
ncbi:asparagine synthase-related protein [Aestuariibacter sp. AA17]|uniref:asparagine synthase (glutamine-hydrolyzing) n=1 Tax=Fluctibacter corallii TaxID=2984329 RepID=A0ABT3ABL3_9ALTE|nr:asparagine synthase-related protein [Aestuariibacter sp. AA17]MCV2886033.1 asparagine synthase-related protein [Aestuariibacter sp. AA17]